MLDTNLKTPQEVRRDIAAKAQGRRLLLNMSQKELAERSGVSLGSVKRFETSGEISLSSMLSIATVLNELAAFAELFSPPRPENLFTNEAPPRSAEGQVKNAMNLDVHLHSHGERQHVGKLAELGGAILFQYAPKFLESGINLHLSNFP